VYKSIIGDIRLWVGPSIEHHLSTWDLTEPTSLHPHVSPHTQDVGFSGYRQPSRLDQFVILAKSCLCTMVRDFLSCSQANSPGGEGESKIENGAFGPTVRVGGTRLVSQKVFIKSFCKSQFPHKSVNLLFILVIIKDNLTDLCGN